MYHQLQQKTNQVPLTTTNEEINPNTAGPPSDSGLRAAPQKEARRKTAPG